MHVSIGGSTVRIVLSNAFGTDTLKIGGANVALANTAGSIKGTLRSRALPRQTVRRHPRRRRSRQRSHRTHLARTQRSRRHASSSPARPSAPSPSTASPTRPTTSSPATSSPRPIFAGATTLRSWPFLKAVEVTAPADAGAIVCFGDSITDGALSTPDKNARWPDVLARRLQADKKTANLGVLNEGIGGNRLLHDVTGPNALERFDRDVLDQSGVKYLIILEGINDIGHAYDPLKPYDVITAEQLEMALTQLIERAHAHGIKVIGATLTPYVGAKYESPAGEKVREAENDFILHSGKFDGVIDFAKVTADPADPTRYAAAADSPDNLHPRDAGYKIMGNSIDLKLFTK